MTKSRKRPVDPPPSLVTKSRNPQGQPAAALDRRLKAEREAQRRRHTRLIGPPVSHDYRAGNPRAGGQR